MYLIDCNALQWITINTLSLNGDHLIITYFFYVVLIFSWINQVHQAAKDVQLRQMHPVLRAVLKPSYHPYQLAILVHRIKDHKIHTNGHQPIQRMAEQCLLIHMLMYALTVSHWVIHLEASRE